MTFEFTRRAIDVFFFFSQIGDPKTGARGHNNKTTTINNNDGDGSGDNDSMRVSIGISLLPLRFFPSRANSQPLLGPSDHLSRVYISFSSLSLFCFSLSPWTREKSASPGLRRKYFLLLRSFFPHVLPCAPRARPLFHSLVAHSVHPLCVCVLKASLSLFLPLLPATRERQTHEREGDGTTTPRTRTTPLLRAQASTFDPAPDMRR